MSTQTLHPLAADYLQQLQAAAGELPAGQRAELLSNIETHLRESTSPTSTDAEVLDVLDRLGDPQEIVAVEQPDPVAARPERGPSEWAAIFLLLFGWILGGLGWIAGLIFLWSSRAWTTREKSIGTLIPLLEILTIVFFAQDLISPADAAMTLGEYLMSAGLVLGVLLTTGTAVYLARQAGGR